MTVVDDPQLVDDLRASVRDVLVRESPIKIVRDVMLGGNGWVDLWGTAKELGWSALGVPEEHGGLGLGLLTQAQVCDELGYAVFSAPLITTMIAGATLAGAPRAAAADRVLEAIAAGAIVAVVAGATVPDHTDGHLLRARTVLDAPRATAIVGTRGDDLYIVDAIGADACRSGPGVDLGRPSTDVVFAAADADPAGRPASALQTTARVLLAGELVGVARRALDIAVAYAGERRQFGRRIGEFQGVKHRLADRAVDLIRARALVYEAAARPDDLHTASLAKAAASGAAVMAVKAAIQITGAVGTTAEHELPWLLRRARHAAQVFGDERYLYAEIGRHAVAEADA
jgi:alkylation response protein AidB-like acyl-CoA dehydrogenase